MLNKSSNGRSLKKSNRYEDTNDMIVEFSNENLIEEGSIYIFRLCTRCSAYYCYHCFGLGQKIIKLLKDRNGNYWFCPNFAKPSLNAILIGKYVEEKCQTVFKTLEPRITKLEDMSMLCEHVMYAK